MLREDFVWLHPRRPLERRPEAIRKLELVLKEIENGKGPVRDPDLYYFAVFGDPDAKSTWGCKWN